MAKLDYSVGAISKEKRIMDAKTYCKKTAAFAGWIIQNVPSDVDMDRWMNDPEGTKQVLAGFKSPSAEKKSTPLFSVVATTTLGTFDEKKTSDCFPEPRYVYRDSDFDNWLPATQSKTDACTIATLAFTEDWTFAEAAAKVLGIGAGTSIKLLGKALIENGHTTTLAQAEEMVEKTERGEKTGMRTDEYANFFFIETGNEDGPVSVGFVYRDGHDWVAYVSSLGRGDRWDADYRLLVRNLDASKL